MHQKGMTYIFDCELSERLEGLTANLAQGNHNSAKQRPKDLETKITRKVNLQYQKYQKQWSKPVTLSFNGPYMRQEKGRRSHALHMTSLFVSPACLHLSTDDSIEKPTLT